ncbi:cytochrome P450 [Stenotrophomonas sp. NPDC077659]|uniref:cytochrome P450 n=1 Tax=Stenotrophomonas sp. NPDC077659 TaxID=3390694 RepID=UPI003D04B0C1
MRHIINFDATSDQADKDPAALYEELHHSNSVLQDKQLDAFFFGRHQDVRLILTSGDFTTAPLEDRAQPVMGDRVLAQMEGKEHKSKRQIILSKLSARTFRERYAPIIHALTRDLLTPKIHSGEIDLVNEFGKNYGILSTLLVLGLPTDRHKDISRWQTGITSFITSLKLSDSEREHSIDCSRCIIEYFQPIIDERMTSPDDSLISALCTAGDDEHMTQSEVIALVLNILLAATEPADKTLAYLFYNLLSNPIEMDRIATDITLLPAAISETLRLNPPVQLIPRQARQDVELDGIKIRKGTLIYCMIGAANRDPDVFPMPSQFILDRKKPSTAGTGTGRFPHHLAFGTGVHVCVGAAFSLMQAELAANTIIDTLGDLRLPKGFRMAEVGFYTRGPVALPLLFTPPRRNNPEERPGHGYSP